MREDTLEKLSKALSKIDRPGSFCAHGSVSAVLPGLEVEGLGPIGLPLTAEVAKELMKHCEQAPYGKGDQTLVDTSVRRVWRLEPKQFALTNPDWKRLVQETVAKVQEELGLEKQKLASHLYDLLLYEPGSFFLPHRDSEKLDRMVATLVLVLPSSYEGGELIVRHDGEEQVIDFGGARKRQFQIHFAAFYADCEHEIRPLRKGYRLCLVYNLTLAKSKKSLTAPRAAEHIERITPLLREWAQQDEALKLVITLDHEYTASGLAWDTLKGVDRVKARVLLEAARQADCKAYLALLTYWESGSAEYADDGYEYGGRRDWYEDYEDEEEDENDYEDDEDVSAYEMGEILDSSLTAEQLIDGDGKGLPIAQLTVEEEELLDPEALTDVKPEEEFEGYTGNAGMTLDRWYRHAAILLWPERHHFEILCDVDSRNVIPVLNQMIKQWQRARSKAALKTQCVELAAAVVARWGENSYGYVDPEEPKASTFLTTLAALDEPRLIHAFLGEVMIKDLSVDPGKAIVAVCQKFGWETFQQEFLDIMRATTIESLERNVRLLDHLCLARPRAQQDWIALCQAAAPELIETLEALDRQSAAYDWRAEHVKRAKVLAGLARALLATDQSDLLGRVVAHTLALPKKYPLTSAHLAALASLRPWLEKHIQKPSATLSQWLGACREQLEALTAQGPQEPADYRRAADVACKCEDCRELNQFLKDPREAVHRFSMRQDRRDHLANEIRQHKCDLDLRTERGRSPHTLVCTKNKASYHASLKKYHEDQEHLETLLAIQRSLSA